MELLDDSRIVRNTSAADNKIASVNWGVMNNRECASACIENDTANLSFL